MLTARQSARSASACALAPLAPSPTSRACGRGTISTQSSPCGGGGRRLLRASAEEHPLPDERLVQRRSLCRHDLVKQFFHYDVRRMARRGSGTDAPPTERRTGRNRRMDSPSTTPTSFSCPTKWGVSWYAMRRRDSSTLPFALVDAEFAKASSLLLTQMVRTPRSKNQL